MLRFESWAEKASVPFVLLSCSSHVVAVRVDSPVTELERGALIGGGGECGHVYFLVFLCNCLFGQHQKLGY